MHEIVLKKRLEQLRRKQREEASKVQEELETALASHGGHVYGEGLGEDVSLEEEESEEVEHEARIRADKACRVDTRTYTIYYVMEFHVNASVCIT